MDYRRKRNDDNSEDTPVYSRLFIVCDKRLTDVQLRNAFSAYGTIEDVYMPRDHCTGEAKGIAYVKFLKTSEAAVALETMHKKAIVGFNKPLKVMVAANRSDVQSEDDNDDRYRRLFLIIPKTDTEAMLEEHFAPFGQIESVIIQRDRFTAESKGGAYVTFRKFSEAAQAFEGCDKKYRAIFALPKYANKRRPETSFVSNISNIAASANNTSSLMSLMNTQHGGYTNVTFTCSPYLHYNQVKHIFDIVPGMVECRYCVDEIQECGTGIVSYSNPVSAAYAVEKLNHFEYPPGCRIFVNPSRSRINQSKKLARIPKVVNNLKTVMAATTPDLALLADAIAEASKIIKVATVGVSEDNVPDVHDLNYCSVKLPVVQPLADVDRTVAKRCFLVCKPQPPPLTVLRDVFCRFGDLINVYTLPNKTVGYARYASVRAADDAIKTLHGAEICGVRMKVIEADEESPPKRARTDQ